MFRRAETGYIQVFFQQDPAGTPYQPPGITSGYTQMDAAGVTGDKTHMLPFDYLAGVADTTTAAYAIFADAGGRLRTNEDYSPPDSFTDPSGNVIPYTQIAPATVSGSLVVPEPAPLGILTLAGAGLLCRHQRRRRKSTKTN